MTDQLQLIMSSWNANCKSSKGAVSMPAFQVPTDTMWQSANGTALPTAWWPSRQCRQLAGDGRHTAEAARGAPEKKVVYAQAWPSSVYSSSLQPYFLGYDKVMMISAALFQLQACLAGQHSTSNKCSAGLMCSTGHHICHKKL